MRSATAPAPETTRTRDLYEVLGVTRTADENAIRQAYLRLARELHPDVSDDPNAEERFQELTGAYTVLSDRGARLLYDKFGYRGRGNGFDASADRSAAPAVLSEVKVDVFEAARGARREVRYASTGRCEACGGRGFAAAAEQPKCGTCNGKGTLARSASLRAGDWLQVEKCPDCDGSGIPAAQRCPECDGQGSRAREEVIKVRIPAGVEDGTRLRVLGNPEDEHLVVQVKPPPAESRLLQALAAVLLVCAVALLAYFLSI
jgi:molecular chaperone DnaJ